MTDRALFETRFGRAPAVAASAPGRVNIIGEHTDYNGGFVLPTAIPQRTHVALAGNGTGTVRVVSENIGADEPAEYELGRETPRHDWLDYVQGVTAVLRDAGHLLAGVDIAISSTVPLGSGLSSSAALEVALLRALRDAFGLQMDDVELARLGRRAENEFVGAPVGIMDQMAASLADPGTALFIDTRTLAHERISLPADCELAVINSGVSHSHAAGEYRTRRRECEEAARALGVAELRDVGEADLRRIEQLPDPISRRARHVVTENARVLDAIGAIRAGDAQRLGALLDASHASMRDDFEVSIPEIDTLVTLARSQPDVYGARLTGGGFGGSIVMLVRAGRAGGAAGRAAAAYTDRTGRRATVLVPPAPREGP